MMSSPHRYTLGQRLSFDSAICTVRYVGPVEGTTKEWIGVEWDEPSRGKHNGQHLGIRYFECEAGGDTNPSMWLILVSCYYGDI